MSSTNMNVKMLKQGRTHALAFVQGEGKAEACGKRGLTHQSMWVY